MTTLQERAKEARLKAGFKSVPPWAKRLGVSTTAVYLIEGGKTLDLKADTASGMAKLSGLSAEWIRTGKGSPQAMQVREEPAPYGDAATRLRQAEDAVNALTYTLAATLRTIAAQAPELGRSLEATLAALKGASGSEKQVIEAATDAVAIGLESSVSAARRASPPKSVGKQSRTGR